MAGHDRQFISRRNWLGLFLQLEGVANQDTVIDGGDVSKAAKPLAFKNGARKKAVKWRA